ncbi:MAG: ABC-F family ATP-binding cassette domain-containing protein [Bacteriovoracaceae bacterium]|nr:ABC-F family ATP-binding cassette domain-containing protein [Bacteriovoracaceae bacterium]
MLNISKLTKRAGGEFLYSDVSFQINPGEKVGLVGPNGAGKTTLFRAIIGEDKSYEGQISLAAHFRLAYFSQQVGEMKGRSALEEVALGDEKISALKQKLHEYEKKLEKMDDMSPDEMEKVLNQMGDAQSQYEEMGGYDIEVRAQEVLTGLGIMPVDHAKPVEDFSGGWKMRIALAKVLVVTPDIIVMDEPTNYLDMESILWLEEWLKNFKGSLFMTTHDRDFMNTICKKIVHLSQGTATVYNGNYDYFLQEKQIRQTQLEAQFDRQQDMLAKEEEFIAKFKARASHAAQVQSRVKKLEKIERVEMTPEEQRIDFEFPEPPRGSDDVVIIQNLGKVWPARKEGQVPHKVFQGLTATIKRQEKIAVVGVNGAGKSTLMKIICGQTDATDGLVKLGASTKLGYFSQYSLDVLNPEATVYDEVRGGLRDASDGHIRNLLAAFLFRGDEIQKKVKFLSGGEKSRLILAVLLSQNNNLLILDEPTNHLDIASREILLEALQKYQGTIMIVSHDRHFLLGLAKKVYEVDHGEIRIIPYTYHEYLEKKKA